MLPRPILKHKNLVSAGELTGVKLKVTRTECTLGKTVEWVEFIKNVWAFPRGKEGVERTV